MFWARMQLAASTRWQHYAQCKAQRRPKSRDAPYLPAARLLQQQELARLVVVELGAVKACGLARREQHRSSIASRWQKDNCASTAKCMPKALEDSMP